MGRPRSPDRTNRSRPLTVAVNDRDRALITANAKACSLSVSAYLRAAGLGKPIHATVDLAAIEALAKVNADQGRLGGLLKLWLTDQPGRGVPASDVRALLARIEALQNLLADIAAKL